MKKKKSKNFIDIQDIKITRNIRTEIKDVSELMQSIRENGLLEPIGLSKINNEYILVYGHRRYLALKKLGRKLLEIGKEAIILDKCNIEDLLVKNTVENLHRENNTPLEFAKAASDLREMGLTTNEIAVRLSVPRSRIIMALNLLSNVPDEQKKYISYSNGPGQGKNGKLLASVASTIADHATRFQLKEKDVKQLYDIAREKELSTKDVRLVNVALSQKVPFKKAINLHNDYRVKYIELIVNKQELKKIKGRFSDYILKVLKGKEILNPELLYKGKIKIKRRNKK